MINNLIYLDNSSTSRPSEKAISAMMPYWTTHWGIPTTPHQKGQELYPALTDFYKILYRFIGANESDQLILTSSGVEAVNHVISSVYRDVTLSTGKNQFLTAKTDEASAIMAVSHLEPFGCVGKSIDVDSQGIIHPQAIADALSPRTALVSLSWANGLTGAIQPVAEIGKLCRERGIRFHLEASHVIGKLFYDLEEIAPDYLTLNGDQIHAPKGTGILYVKEGIKCSPFIFGSADQGGMRAGAINMAALAGLATAAQEAIHSQDLLCTEIARLRNTLEQEIVRKIPEAKIFLEKGERLPHCTTLLFPGIANEALLFLINRRGICASIGGGSFQQIGLMLASTGIEESLAHSAISFSLSRYTTEEEINRAIPLIIESVQTLIQLSKNL